jgi:hypothetical protein
MGGLPGQLTELSKLASIKLPGGAPQACPKCGKMHADGHALKMAGRNKMMSHQFGEEK